MCINTLKNKEQTNFIIFYELENDIRHFIIYFLAFLHNHWKYSHANHNLRERAKTNSLINIEEKCIYKINDQSTIIFLYMQVDPLYLILHEQIWCSYFLF